jgi:hypothetical protein
MRKGDSPTANLVQATEQHPEGPAEENLSKPFKPQRIDLTPTEPVNIGYVGGVRVPKKTA